MSILDNTDSLIDESANIGVSSAPISQMQGAVKHKTPISDLMLGDKKPKKLIKKSIKPIKPKKLLYLGTSKTSLGLNTK